MGKHPSESTVLLIICFRTHKKYFSYRELKIVHGIENFERKKPLFEKSVYVNSIKSTRRSYGQTKGRFNDIEKLKMPRTARY